MWSEHPSIHTKIVCIWELLLLLFGGGTDSRPHSFGGMSFGGVWIFPSKTRPSRALILGMRLLHTWQEAIPINFGPAQSLLAGLRIYSMDGWSEGSRRSKQRKKERKLYIHFNFVGSEGTVKQKGELEQPHLFLPFIKVRRVLFSYEWSCWGSSDVVWCCMLSLEWLTDFNYIGYIMLFLKHMFVCSVRNSNVCFDLISHLWWDTYIWAVGGWYHKNDIKVMNVQRKSMWSF